MLGLDFGKSYQLESLQAGNFLFQIWCAAGVNLTGGRTKDGGCVVGASVFYSSPPETDRAIGDGTEVDKLDSELKVITCLCLDCKALQF